VHNLHAFLYTHIRTQASMYFKKGNFFIIKELLVL
jgi:hypothetical protein